MVVFVYVSLMFVFVLFVFVLFVFVLFMFVFVLLMLIFVYVFFPLTAVKPSASALGSFRGLYTFVLLLAV